MIMARKEFQIGEVFQFGLLKLRCEERKNYCQGCALINVDECDDLHPFVGFCNKEDRYDNNDVIFVKVEDSHLAKETVHRYSLRTDANAWLGDVILTDDKKFYSITDWGNFNFGWTVSGDIRKFILTLDEDYFARKMFQGVSYQCSSKTMQTCCKRFASRILPKLKEAIQKELEKEEKG